MTPDDFVKFYTDRWTAKNPTAFADDCRGFLREYAGDVLAKAARKLAAEWNGRFPPTIPEIRTICAAMTSVRAGERDYGGQFRYAKKRAPEIEQTWRMNNPDVVRAAITNKKDVLLDALVREGAWWQAQIEYRKDDGYPLRPFELTEHDRSFMFLPPRDAGIKGDLGAAA